ncbi:MAG: DMT family transporter [Clostridiales Family XIII bacterium]|jgi:drug/metabolite transporter (DMT)-like permease|nr:DMT family transporter [Clostridiales Family XIII bacterium]
MKKTAVCIVLSALFFGTMEVALKLAGNTLDAFQITFLRFLIGGVLLLPFAVRERRKQPDRKMKPRLWLYMVFLGAVNVPFCMIFFQLGIAHANAATAAVIFSCNPIFTMLLAHVFTKDDKMNPRKAAALFIGLAGILFMIRPWDIQPGNTLLGAALSILAAAIFGLYSVLGAKTVAKAGAFTQTSVSFIAGSLILLLVLNVTGKPILAGAPENIAILLYVSIIVTGGGYLFYFLAIKYSDATTGSIVFFLKPVLAPIFAVAILHEAVTWNMYLGIAIILAASYILIAAKKKAPGTVIK